MSQLAKQYTATKAAINTKTKNCDREAAKRLAVIKSSSHPANEKCSLSTHIYYFLKGKAWL